MLVVLVVARMKIRPGRNKAHRPCRLQHPGIDRPGRFELRRVEVDGTDGTGFAVGANCLAFSQQMSDFTRLATLAGADFHLPVKHTNVRQASLTYRNPKRRAEIHDVSRRRVDDETDRRLWNRCGHNPAMQHNVHRIDHLDLSGPFDGEARSI